MHNKKALVITGHVKNSLRLGGFHFFVKYLTGAGYDVDWVTNPVSITWLLRHDDKCNPRNFFDLWRGISWQENNTTIRHFAVPVWIPACVARMLGMKLATHFYPRWEKLRKRLRDSYDAIVLEGVACQWAQDLRRDYPAARIIYRPSDALKLFSAIPNPDEFEVNMIKAADIVGCVDENHVNYYRGLVEGLPGEQAKVKLFRNPITTQADIATAETFKPVEHKPSVVYVGVSFVDFELIDYAAARNKEATFYIIGPSEKSHDNVVYTGMLTEEEYSKYLLTASVGITPAKLQAVYGYTRKIIKYMKYLLPIVATWTDNYLNIPGLFCVDTQEEFAQKISDCLKYSPQDRENLRAGYLRCMRVFSEEESHKTFLEYLR